MPAIRTSRSMDPTLVRLCKAQEVFEQHLNFVRTALASPALNPTTISDLAATTREKARSFAAITRSETETFAAIIAELDKLHPMATSLQALATEHLSTLDAHLVGITNELTILSTKLDPPRRRAGIKYVVPLLNNTTLIDMVKTASFVQRDMQRIHESIDAQVRVNAEAAAEWRERDLAAAIRRIAGSRFWQDLSERGRERLRNKYRRDWGKEPEPEKPPPAFGDPPDTPWETRIKHQSFR